MISSGILDTLAMRGLYLLGNSIVELPPGDEEDSHY
jgi:hypothetical protein